MQSHKKNVHLIHLGICIHSFSTKTWITIQLYQRHNRYSPRKLCLPKNGKIQFLKRGKHWILSRNQSKIDIKKGTQTKNWRNLLMVRSRWWRYKKYFQRNILGQQNHLRTSNTSLRLGPGIDYKRITSNVYELRTSPDNAAILKSILYKASHPDNNPTIKFILYKIQGITYKDIYKTIIKK